MFEFIQERRVLVIPNIFFDDLEHITNKEGQFILKETDEKLPDGETLKAAEHNFDYRQLIPYGILVDIEEKKILAYRKTKESNEKRLHGFWSIGVGGHVEPCDGEGWDAVENAFKREMKEELGVEPIVTIGDKYIYSDETEVDRVHLGIARIVTRYEGVLRPSREIPVWEWCSIKELQQRKLETWSVECLNWIIENWGDLLDCSEKDPATSGEYR